MDFVHVDSNAALAEDARDIIRRRAAKSGRNKTTQPHVHLDHGKKSKAKPKNRHRDHVIRWRYQPHPDPAAHSNSSVLVVLDEADFGEPKAERPLSPLRRRPCPGDPICTYCSQAPPALSCSSITNLKSPAAFRTQVNMLYLQRCLIPHHSKAAQVKVRYGQWRERALSPAMREAIDCGLMIYLQQLVPSKEDPHQTRRMYCRALARINEELKGKEARQHDGVLAAVSLLAALSSGNSNLRLPVSEYYHHLDGQLSVIEFRGPSIMNTTLGRDITLEALPVAVMRGIIRRQPSFFAQPHWTRALRLHCYTPFRQLILLGIYLTHAMANLDTALDGPVDKFLVESCLTALRQCDVRLREWLFSWYFSQDKSPNPLAKPASAFPLLPITIRRLVTVDCPFDDFYEFREQDDGFIHLTYFTLRFILHQCIVELIERVPSLDTRSDNVANRPAMTSAEDDCNKMADSISRSVPYMRSKGISTLGLVFMRDTLALVGDWYAKRGNVVKAEWCATVLFECSDYRYRSRYSGDPRLKERAFCGNRWMMLEE